MPKMNQLSVENLKRKSSVEKLQKNNNQTSVDYAKKVFIYCRLCQNLII